MGAYADKSNNVSDQSKPSKNSFGIGEKTKAGSMVDNRPEAVLQRSIIKMANPDLAVQPIQKKKNNTGLPDGLKAGIEQLSGYSMDDVKVHYNSNNPEKLNAHAYAQGNQIHLAPGQAKHLPHEAWHVVQQKQGRVKPTMQMKGKINVNDDAGLEQEADLMGEKAMRYGNEALRPSDKADPVQRKLSEVATAIVKNGSTEQQDKLNFLARNRAFQLKRIPEVLSQEQAPQMGDNSISLPIQRIQALYNFAEGEFIRDLSNQHRGVYLIRANDEQLVVKFDPGANELGLMNLARQIGMNVPATRVLSAAEVHAVNAMEDVTNGGNNALAMDFAGGHALEYFRGNEDLPPMGEIFNQQLLVDIGMSYGFQLLTGSADRWPMPVNVGPATLTEGNSGNILLDHQNSQVHDIDLTAGNPGDNYATSLRVHLQDMLTNADGGGLVTNVTNFIAREYHANYNIPAQARPWIRQGIRNAMQAIGNIDVAASGVDQNIQNRITQVRQVYAQEVQQLNNQNKCCYITTACTNAHNLADNCLELETLRAFRDGYVAKKQDGEELIRFYYKHSPRIVIAIDKQSNAKHIYSSLYTVIFSCVRNIWDEEYLKAFQMYIEMVVKLAGEYCPDINIPHQFKQYTDQNIL